MPLDWSKELARTDAQEKTRGWKVKYLRLTRSGSPHETKTWFRKIFFDTTPWSPGHFGKSDVEETFVDFHVTILGQYQGLRTMRITHNPHRQDSHSHPNTWIHYDDDTIDGFATHDLTGHTVNVDRDDNGEYHFTID